MEPDTPLAATPSRRIALLIDADNVSHAKIGAILAELSKYGTANIRRAYGNWAAATLKEWYLFPETLPSALSPAGYASVDSYIDALTQGARSQRRDPP